MLLEGVKTYANPSRMTNRNHIGLGNKSKTMEIYVVATNLPDHKLYDKDNYIRELDASSIKDERTLNRLFVCDDDGLDLKLEEAPGSKTLHFRFIDTPGPDDSEGNDAKHFARIISGLTEAQEVHRHVPFVQSQKDTLVTYFHVSEELERLLLIDHTHDPNLHHHAETPVLFVPRYSQHRMQPRSMRIKPMTMVNGSSRSPAHTTDARQVVSTLNSDR
ncbi:hypothetical protein B0O80DRAFT_53435 [Mortierella sp. GBAus27b]|nr:hypothetical protein B0O80DRAFT_53435 [Mortierella sp. GBAus27b]